MGDCWDSNSRFEIRADIGRFRLLEDLAPRRVGRGKNRPPGGHRLVSRKENLREKNSYRNGESTTGESCRMIESSWKTCLFGRSGRTKIFRNLGRKRIPFLLIKSGFRRIFP
jgi:hypothetical protein